jgi:hypothetical protein
VIGQENKMTKIYNNLAYLCDVLSDLISWTGLSVKESRIIDGSYLLLFRLFPLLK